MNTAPGPRTTVPETARATSTLAPLVILAALIVVGAGLYVVTPTWGSVLLLGVVEGVTEFLPISSTAHLLIAARLLHFDQNIGGTFEIFIQLGAILAVVGYYARDLLAQARALPNDRTVQKFWLAIGIAFVPAAVVGLLLRKWIKSVLFDSPATIAWALIIGGLVLVLVEWLPRRRVTTTDAEQITPVQALGIGIAQVLALIPGTSRSATSIIGGVLGGLDRRAATVFSFYLAIPTLGAATIVDLLGSLHAITSADVGRLAVGTLVAFVVAWLSIGWLLRYVSRHNFVGFGIYRVVAGAVILVLTASGLL